MLRRSFILLAVTFLLLCLATTGVVIRSYWVGDQISRASIFVGPSGYVGRVAILTTGQGSILLQWMDTTIQPVGSLPPKAWSWNVSHPAHPIGTGVKDTFWNRLGFRYSATGPMSDPSTAHRYIVFPVWCLVGVLGLLAIFSAGVVRRLKTAARKGVCPGCGYDLRATPERCPECGIAANI